MKPTDDVSHISENGISTTPRTDDTPCQATPSADLRQQIMDSRVPKNEREWWAQRTIEKLETELASMKARAEKAEAKIITARLALSRIANSDYRGNRSTESQIAFAALEEIK